MNGLTFKSIQEYTITAEKCVYDLNISPHMLHYSREYYWKTTESREKKTNFSTNYYTNVEHTERIIANEMQINDVNKYEWNNFI